MVPVCLSLCLSISLCLSQCLSLSITLSASVSMSVYLCLFSTLTLPFTFVMIRENVFANLIPEGVSSVRKTAQRWLFSKSTNSPITYWISSSKSVVASEIFLECWGNLLRSHLHIVVHEFSHRVLNQQAATVQCNWYFCCNVTECKFFRPLTQS